MKKTLKYFSLLLMVLVVLTGCGKKDPRKQLEGALEKLDDAESMSFKMDADMSVSAEGTTMSVGLGLNGDYSEKTDTGHFTMNVSLLGMNQEIEMYMTEKDDNTYVYTKSEDGWTYTKEVSASEEKEAEDITDILDEAKSIKEVKSDKKGYTKLEVVVSKDKLNKAMNENKDAVSEVVGEETIAINKDMVIDVYLKKGEIRIVRMDLTDLLKDSMGAEAASADIKAVITLEITDYNKSNKLQVPEEVTKNAKEELQIEMNDSDLNF